MNRYPDALYRLSGNEMGDSEFGHRFSGSFDAASTFVPVGSVYAASQDYEFPDPLFSIHTGSFETPIGDSFPSQNSSARSDFVFPDDAKGGTLGRSRDSLGSDSPRSSRLSSCEIDFSGTMKSTNLSDSFPSDSSGATRSASSSMILEQVAPPSHIYAAGSQCVSQSSRESSCTTATCPICERPALGTHFGVETCAPCGSFFRRIIRSGIVLVCKADNNCALRKQTLLRCRACRFQRCLAVGMNTKAVECARDSIVQRKRRTAPDPTEANIRKIADFSSVFPSGGGTNIDRAAATLKDVADRLNNVTTSVFLWAKGSPGFSKFTTADQSALVHNHRIPHLLLEIAARSRLCHPYLLGDKYFIDARPMAQTQAIAEIISLGITGPLKEIKLTEAELGLIKYFIFYDSSLPMIADVPLVSEWQTAMFIALRKLVASGSGALQLAEIRFQQICSLIDSWNSASFRICKILRQAGLLQQIFA